MYKMMLGSAVLGVFVLLAGCSQQTGAPLGSTGPQWKIAVMSYTFNRFTLVEAIDKTRAARADYLETFSWQKIGGEAGDAQFNASAPEAALAVVRKKLADCGVTLTGYYSNELGKDEAVSRKVFGFCKSMSIPSIIAEPAADKLDLIDKLAAEYQVKVAIHNHPKDPKHGDYKNWDPDNVMVMLKGRSKWLGTCADNGHWVRSGLDPVECIKKYEGRLISLHCKDVNTMGPAAHDVPYGTGVVNLMGMMKELKRQNFAGVFSIEYENNMEDNMADVAQCITWFNEAKTKLGVRR